MKVDIKGLDGVVEKMHELGPKLARIGLAQSFERGRKFLDSRSREQSSSTFWRPEKFDHQGCEDKEGRWGSQRYRLGGTQQRMHLEQMARTVLDLEFTACGLNLV